MPSSSPRPTTGMSPPRWPPSGPARMFTSKSESVQSRQPAVSSIEDAVQADLLCHLSDLATRLHRKLTFDFQTERFLKDDEANQRLQLREMRKPWSLI